MKGLRMMKEIENWLNRGIIIEAQFEETSKDYESNASSSWLIWLATFLIGLSILLLALSDWAQIPNVMKVFILFFFMLTVYVLGFWLITSKRLSRIKRNHILGLSMISLGYVLFGATLILLAVMYDVTLWSAWPFVWWSAIGLLLYIIVPHPFLFSIALVVTVTGQIFSAFQLGLFNYLLFFIFFFGYFHFVFHRGTRAIHYLFSIGLVIQLLLFNLVVLQQFYTFSLLLLMMFALSIVLPRRVLYERMALVTTLALMFYKVYEALAIQNTIMMDELQLRVSFFVLYIPLFLLLFVLLFFIRREQRSTLLLFLPVFFLPQGGLFLIIIFFIYALAMFMKRGRKYDGTFVLLGFTSFVLGVITILLQDQWSLLVQSMLLLIIGIVFFLFYVAFEKRGRGFL